MYQDDIVLCGASAYTKKYYFNDNFSNLPDQIKIELKILCVLYTEDAGGTLQLIFDSDGNLTFRTEYEEDDFTYDEIGSILKIKQFRREKQDLLESLEKYFKVFFLDASYGED